MIEQGAAKPKPNWALAFIDRPDGRLLAWRAEQMAPSQYEIYTGKLRYTRTFFDSIKSGQVTHFRREKPLTLEDCLGVLAILSTHHHIARTGEFRLADPGFWVRVPYGEAHVLRGSRLVPVMPTAQLSALSGRSEADLTELLRPLLEDKAIRVLRNQKGTHGIMLNEGFVCVHRFQGLLRP